MANFDYESSYKKIMKESINNIRKMDEKVLQHMANKINNDIDIKIKGNQNKK